MTTRPSILVQMGSRAKVSQFREGLGDTLGVVVLGLESKAFWTLAGIDALFLTFTRAERFGSRPLPPYVAALLRTSDEYRREGTPPYVITGVNLQPEDDPYSASLGIPCILSAVLKVAAETNAATPGAIRTIGFFEYELSFKRTPLVEIGRIFGSSLRSAT